MVLSRHSRSRLLRGATFALAVLLPPLLLCMLPVEILDDAYITARYVRNLIDGHGLVYNVGERVEGITNLSWALLLTIPARMGLPIDVSAVVLSVLCGILAMLGTYRLARLLGAGVGCASICTLVMVIDAHYWLALTNGLEGGLYSLLLVLVAESVLAKRPPALVGLLAGLLFLTRPESGVVALLCAAYLAFEHSEELSLSRARLRNPAWLLLTFGLIAGAATLFRLSYYGAVLPNSVTAKSVPMAEVLPILRNLERGGEYLLDFLGNAFPLLLGGGLAAWLAPSRRVFLLLAIFLCEVPPVVLNGGDWMPHQRLLVVYGPLLAALLGLSLEQLRARATSGAVGLYGRNGLYAVVALGALAMVWFQEWQSPRAELGYPGILHCYAAIGERLAPIVQEGDVVAAEAIGLIGFQLPNTYVHDLMGLTDAWVARHGRYRQRAGRVDYLHTYQKVHPSLILIHEEDVALLHFEKASRGKFSQEYTSYFVDPPPPCASYAGRRTLLSVRNDLLPKVMARLQLPVAPVTPQTDLVAAQRVDESDVLRPLRRKLGW